MAYVGVRIHLHHARPSIAVQQAKPTTLPMVKCPAGERLYTAGRNGAEDLYEQPFRSFDATYSFYPTENLILKVKLMNLLDEAITIERDGVLVFEEKPGMAISASAKYDF